MNSFLLTLNKYIAHGLCTNECNKRKHGPNARRGMRAQKIFAAFVIGIFIMELLLDIDLAYMYVLMEVNSKYLQIHVNKCRAFLCTKTFTSHSADAL